MIQTCLKRNGNADETGIMTENRMELKKRGLDWAVVDVADMDLAFQGTLRTAERCNDHMCCLYCATSRSRP